jgi:hypothetical protein
MLGLFRRLSSFGQEHIRIVPPATRQAQPQLEALEERCVPATLTVTNLLDSGSGSLRAQVGAASPGDIINFARGLSGTIVLTSGEIAFSKSLTIQGPGAGVISVDGNNASRIFDITGGSSTVTISGLTLTKGNGNSGLGGLGGGAIRDSNGNLTVADSVLSGNTSASLGGGLSAYGGTVTIQDSTISGNTSNNGGGGVFLAYGGIKTIIDSTISGNQGNYGGGIFLYNSPSGSAIQNCTITGNTATITSRYAGFQVGGGGILLYNGAVAVDNCTIAGNSANSSNGGGIWVGGGAFKSTPSVLTLRSTIVSGNTDRTGAEDIGRNTAYTTTINGSNDLIQATPTTGASGTINGTNTANIFGKNPLLGPLQNNGGPTQTMLPAPGSPAIDAGSNPDNLSTDQRGDPRVAGSAPDIGAVEVQPAAFPPATVAPSVTIAVPPPLDAALTTINTAMSKGLAVGLNNEAAFGDPAQAMMMEMDILAAYQTANALAPAETGNLVPEEAMLAFDLALYINAPDSFPPNAPQTFLLAAGILELGQAIGANPISLTTPGRLGALLLGLDLSLMIHQGTTADAAVAGIQALMS